MTVQQLFGHYFSFLRDNLVARKVVLATKSDTTDDPAGEGWVMTLVDGTVTVLPSANPNGSTVALPLKALQVLPIRVRRVLNLGTDAINVYILQ